MKTTIKFLGLSLSLILVSPSAFAQDVPAAPTVTPSAAMEMTHRVVNTKRVETRTPAPVLAVEADAPKFAVRVVRKRLPAQNTAIRSGTKGWVVPNTDNHTVDMSIQPYSKVKTSTPNLFKPHTQAR